MSSPIIQLLRWNLQPEPGRRNWHGGPSPVTALRGVTPEQAAWRATPRRTSIWGLALHIAYWKYTVRRHLSLAPVARFPRRPANFPSVPVSPDADAWARDVALLRSEHDQLVAAVLALDERRLAELPPAGRRWTYGELALGIAAHDAYHTGQIQLLKRLWSERAALGRQRG
jgi:DinB family protein